MLNIGDQAPLFEGVNQNNGTITLSDFSGKRVILYFYPKDNTSGCTAEACSLRDGYLELVKRGFVVVGVSPDTTSSHQKFIEKQSLPFPLLSDTSHQIATLYGTWGEKKLYGKTYIGMIRKTFVIDGNGIIEKVFNKVDTKHHFEQILKEY